MSGILTIFLYSSGRAGGGGVGGGGWKDGTRNMKRQPLQSSAEEIIATEVTLAMYIFWRLLLTWLDPTQVLALT